MFNELWTDWAGWWESVTPEFGFLLALPFLVVAAGLVAECLGPRWRRR